MFENINNDSLLTPDMIKTEFRNSNDIIDNYYKGFIYWLNKQVDKAIVRFKQGKDKNELKSHVIRIDNADTPRYIRKLLRCCNNNFKYSTEFTDKEKQVMKREVAWLEQFLKANDWQYIGFGDMCVSSDSDYKYTFHWRKFNNSAKNSSFNPYNEANEVIKIIKGSALDKYDIPDIKGFTTFFNKLALKQLNDESNLTNQMNREIYLYSKDMPAKFRYIREEENSYKWYKIYQPYLDYLSDNGWRIEYNDEDSKYMPKNAGNTYYKFIF